MSINGPGSEMLRLVVVCFLAGFLGGRYLIVPRAEAPMDRAIEVGDQIGSAEALPRPQPSLSPPSPAHKVADERVSVATVDRVDAANILTLQAYRDQLRANRRINELKVKRGLTDKKVRNRLAASRILTTREDLDVALATMTPEGVLAVWDAEADLLRDLRQRCANLDAASGALEHPWQQFRDALAAELMARSAPREMRNRLDHLRLQDVLNEVK